MACDVSPGTMFLQRSDPSSVCEGSHQTILYFSRLVLVWTVIVRGVVLASTCSDVPRENKLSLDLKKKVSYLPSLEVFKRKKELFLHNNCSQLSCMPRG